MEVVVEVEVGCVETVKYIEAVLTAESSDDW